MTVILKHCQKHAAKICKNIAKKHSKEKPVLLNCANLSTTFSPWMSQKIYFHTLLGPDPMEFKISENACIWKVSFALKTHIRFRATELRQKIKFDVFRKPLFCNLARTRNLVPDAVPNAARQYLQRDFTFSTTKWSFLEFQRSKKLKRKFSDNIEQNIWRPFHQPGH